MSVTCFRKRHERPHAAIHIAAVHGERRIVGYRVVNDASEPVHVAPAFQPLEDLTSGAPVTIAPWTSSPAGVFDVASSTSRELLLTVETSGLLKGHVYRTELVLGGTRIEPVSILVSVEAAEPIVGRHDSSRLRAWVRGCCFGHDVTAIYAPGQEPEVCGGVRRWGDCR